MSEQTAMIIQKKISDLLLEKNETRKTEKARSILAFIDGYSLGILDIEGK
jgi:hypothetical protein